jgi:hypothetical protein
MIDALSTPSNRIATLLLLLICSLLTITAAFLGVDDNPPGILLAYLAAISFVLAFTHPWRTVRKFVFLLLASVLGFVLFIILNIIFDTITQNLATSEELLNLIQSPTTDALILTFTMICPAAFIIGVVGSVLTFIRSHRQKT